MMNSPQVPPLPSVDRLVPMAATAGQEDRMREAMSDQIGPRLDQIIRRLDVLEERCQRIEMRLRDMGGAFPIPVAEYLPRG